MSMAAQTNYNFGFSKGVAGGLFDLSAHEVSTRQAEGKGITFGIGVVVGTNKGVDIKLPDADSAGIDFEGVVVHNSVMTELDMDNKLVIKDKRTVGCRHHGKVWVKTGENAKPAYKERVYMITDGEEAGMFTTSEDKATKIAVNGVFLGETDDGIANAEFIPISVMAATTEGGTE